MAKRPAQKVDPIATALSELVTADKETAKALRFLYKALMQPVQRPDYQRCKFKIGKVHYNCRIWLDQSQAILKVVNAGGNVKAEIDSIVAGLNCRIVACQQILAESVGVADRAFVIKPVQLGCCVYDGGTTPNLSQAQCNQYNPVQWNPANLNPDCDPRDLG
jgi:hypothetical protein